MRKESLSVLVNSIAAYCFECEARPLQTCAEWIELRRRLNCREVIIPAGVTSSQSPRLEIQRHQQRTCDAAQILVLPTTAGKL